jgi:hypothetical protein
VSFLITGQFWWDKKNEGGPGRTREWAEIKE